jgi:hypothetical protein
MDKLRKYIREYVMYLYNAKIADADEDYQWKHPSDVDHPIEPYDADNKLPPHYFRHRSTAKPNFENKNMSEEIISQQFVDMVKDEFDLETLELMKQTIEDQIDMINTIGDITTRKTIKGFSL